MIGFGTAEERPSKIRGMGVWGAHDFTVLSPTGEVALKQLKLEKFPEGIPKYCEL